MGINIGLKKLKECYVGSKRVKEIYVGNNKVWPDEADSIGGGEERNEILEFKVTQVSDSLVQIAVGLRNLDMNKKYILKSPNSVTKDIPIEKSNATDAGVFYINVFFGVIILCDENGDEIIRQEWSV